MVELSTEGRNPLRLYCHSFIAFILIQFSFGIWNHPLHAQVDCNGNGIEDRKDILDQTSLDCDLNGIPDECDNDPFNFTLEKTILPLPQIPRVVVVGDFDRNGAEDIIAGARGVQESSKLFLFLNDGFGTFVSPSMIEVGEGFGGLTTGDIDNDGDLDLVALGSDEISVLKNDARAQFSLFEKISVSASSPHVQLADYDGDGRLDLFTTTSGDRHLQMRSQDQDGHFQWVKNIEVGGIAGRFDLKDLDGDGLLDIAITLRRNGNFAVIKQTEGGEFAAPQLFPLQGIDPVNVVAAPLDDQPGLDLAIGTEVALEIFNQRFDGTFTAANSYKGLRSIVLAHDLNSDGDVDLLSPTINPHGVIIRGNDTQGNFDRSEQFLSARAPTTLAFGDFNRDGHPDIVLASASPSSLSILKGGSFNGVSVVNQTIPLDNCRNDIRAGCAPHAGGLGDIDGDGDLDLIASNTIPGSISVVLNHGEDQFELLDNHIIQGTHPFSLALGHIDDDENLDVITADDFNDQLSVHLGNGDGTFQAPILIDIPGTPIDVELADLDGDGRLEAGVVLRDTEQLAIIKNEDLLRTHFPLVTKILIGKQPQGLKFFDFNNDNLLDVATTNFGSKDLTLILNQGELIFKAHDRIPLRFPPGQLDQGDVDGDGFIDLAIVSYQSEEAAIFYNNSGKSFSPPRFYALGRAPISVTLADFDGDGLQDILTADEVENTVTYVPGEGNREFGFPFHYPVGKGLRHVFAADVDQDGDTDLITPDRLGFSYTLLWNQQPKDQEEIDFLEKICTVSQFRTLAKRNSNFESNRIRSVKFMLPWGDDAPNMPLVFFNTQKHSLHYEFLQAEFGDLFPALDPVTYYSWVANRETRRFFTGSISEYHVDGRSFFGVEFFAQFSDPIEQPTLFEVRSILQRLSAQFDPRSLVYAPISSAAISQARAWPPEFVTFDLYLEGLNVDSNYQAYTLGVSFGRLKFLTLNELRELEEKGGVSFTDFLVLEQAPSDIEGVFGGVLTAEPQLELSHLGVRTARRGTPNGYLKDIWQKEDFRSLEGELVRVELLSNEVLIQAADLEEAEVHWEQSRPQLSVLPSLDAEPREILNLDQLSLLDRESQESLIASYGGKSVQLARLQAVLADQVPRLRTKGLSIPISHYLEFLDSNTIPSFFDTGKLVTYREYLTEVIESPEFNSNSEMKHSGLRLFRDHVEENGVVSPSLLEDLANKILETFGEAEIKLRSRSSSNAEDLLEFNGAGLYDSTSACLADDQDEDSDGPSHCDSNQDDERGLGRALKRVWASLWNFRAYEERAYFGIPQNRVGMGILITPAFNNEKANGVIFSGNPVRAGDRRYLVLSQVGDHSVVNPTPGVVAERALLTRDGPNIVDIQRINFSSLLPPGQVAVPEADLEELGEVLNKIQDHFPIDSGEHDPRDVLLDLEFKLDSQGELAIKQIRPFLHPISVTTLPKFDLQFGSALELCGQFLPGRTLQKEQDLKISMKTVSSLIRVELADEKTSSNWIHSIDFRFPRLDQVIDRSGEISLRRIGVERGMDVFEVQAQQDWILLKGITIHLTLRGWKVFAPQGSNEVIEATLDPDLIGEDVVIFGEVRDFQGELVGRLDFGTCTESDLPLWVVNAELSDGTFLSLEERHGPELLKNKGATLFTRAQAWFEKRVNFRQSDDYFKLIYAARRHNQAVQYRFIFDEPVLLAHVQESVHGLELHTPYLPEEFAGQGIYLDQNLQPIHTVELNTYDRRIFTGQRVPFRRGDADANSEIEIADSLFLLTHLFLGGEAPLCRAASDANGDAAINLSDPIAILAHMFLGDGPLPEPFLECGRRIVPVDLDCHFYPPCEGG